MNTPEILAGSLGLILALVLLAIGIIWLIFPFLVIGRLDKLIKLQEKNSVTRVTPPAPASGYSKSPAQHVDPDIAEHLARKAQRGET